MISTFLFVVVIGINLILFSTTWSSDNFMFEKIIFFEHLSGGLSVFSLIVGTFYILREELEEYKSRKK